MVAEDFVFTFLARQDALFFPNSLLAEGRNFLFAAAAVWEHRLGSLAEAGSGPSNSANEPDGLKEAIPCLDLFPPSLHQRLGEGNRNRKAMKKEMKVNGEEVPSLPITSYSL